MVSRRSAVDRNLEGIAWFPPREDGCGDHANAKCAPGMKKVLNHLPSVRLAELLSERWRGIQRQAYA